MPAKTSPEIISDIKTIMQGESRTAQLTEYVSQQVQQNPSLMQHADVSKEFHHSLGQLLKEYRNRILVQYESNVEEDIWKLIELLQNKMGGIDNLFAIHHWREFATLRKANPLVTTPLHLALHNGMKLTTFAQLSEELTVEELNEFIEQCTSLPDLMSIQLDTAEKRLRLERSLITLIIQFSVSPLTERKYDAVYLHLMHCFTTSLTNTSPGYQTQVWKLLLGILNKLPKEMMDPTLQLQYETLKLKITKEPAKTRTISPEKTAALIAEKKNEGIDVLANYISNLAVYQRDTLNSDEVHEALEKAVNELTELFIATNGKMLVTFEAKLWRIIHDGFNTIRPMSPDYAIALWLKVAPLYDAKALSTPSYLPIYLINSMSKEALAQLPKHMDELTRFTTNCARIMSQFMEMEGEEEAAGLVLEFLDKICEQLTGKEYEDFYFHLLECFVNLTEKPQQGFKHQLVRRLHTILPRLSHETIDKNPMLCQEIEKHFQMTVKKIELEALITKFNEILPTLEKLATKTFQGTKAKPVTQLHMDNYFSKCFKEYTKDTKNKGLLLKILEALVYGRTMYELKKWQGDGSAALITFMHERIKELSGVIEEEFAAVEPLISFSIEKASPDKIESMRKELDKFFANERNKAFEDKVDSLNIVVSTCKKRLNLPAMAKDFSEIDDLLQQLRKQISLAKNLRNLQQKCQPVLTRLVASPTASLSTEKPLFPPRPSAPPLPTLRDTATQSEIIIAGVIKKKTALGPAKVMDLKEYVTENIRTNAATMHSPLIRETLQNAIIQYVSEFIKCYSQDKPMDTNLEVQTRKLFNLLQFAMGGMDDERALFLWNPIFALYRACPVAPIFMSLGFHSKMRDSALRKLPENSLRFAVAEITQITKDHPQLRTESGQMTWEHLLLQFVAVCNRSLSDQSYHDFYLYMARHFIDASSKLRVPYQHRLGILLKNVLDGIETTTLSPNNVEEYQKLTSIITRMVELSDNDYTNTPLTIEEMVITINKKRIDIEALAAFVSDMASTLPDMLLTDLVHEALQNAINTLIEHWMQKAARGETFPFETKLKQVIYTSFCDKGRMDDTFFITQLQKILPQSLSGELDPKSFLPVFLINHMSAEALAKLPIEDLQQLISTFTKSIEASLNSPKNIEKVYVETAIPHARSFLEKIQKKLTGRTYDAFYLHLLTCFNKLIQAGHHELNQNLVKPLRSISILESLPRDAVMENLRQSILNAHQAVLFKVFSDSCSGSMPSFTKLTQITFELQPEEEKKLNLFLSTKVSELQELRKLSKTITDKSLLLTVIKTFAYGYATYSLRRWQSTIKGGLKPHLNELIKELSDLVEQEIAAVRPLATFSVKTATMADLQSTLNKLTIFLGQKGWNVTLFNTETVALKKMFDQAKLKSSSIQQLADKMTTTQKEYNLLKQLRTNCEAQLKRLEQEAKQPQTILANPPVVAPPQTSGKPTSESKEPTVPKATVAMTNQEASVSLLPPALDEKTPEKTEELLVSPRSTESSPEDDTPLSSKKDSESDSASFDGASTPATAPVTTPAHKFQSRSRLQREIKRLRKEAKRAQRTEQPPKENQTLSVLKSSESEALGSPLPKSESTEESWVNMSSKMFAPAIAALDKISARDGKPMLFTTSTSHVSTPTRKDPATPSSQPKPSTMTLFTAPTQPAPPISQQVKSNHQASAPIAAGPVPPLEPQPKHVIPSTQSSTTETAAQVSPLAHEASTQLDMPKEELMTRHFDLTAQCKLLEAYYKQLEANIGSAKAELKKTKAYLSTNQAHLSTTLGEIDAAEATKARYESEIEILKEEHANVSSQNLNQGFFKRRSTSQSPYEVRGSLANSI